MSNRVSNAAISPVVVTASILLATLLLLAFAANQAFAQEAGSAVSYAENGTGPVETYTALDPEGRGIGWSVEGTDRALFTAEGGVLAFKSSPNYEDPKDMAHSADGPDDGNDPDIEGDTDDDAMNNVYVVKVRATEVVPEDQVEPAKYTEIQVRVTVTNVDEAGEASIDWRQPQVGVELEAMASDPDTRSATVPSLTITFAWQWSVPKVSRPETDNNNHWVAAGNTDTTSATYTPHPDDVGEVLRAQATYTDGTGEERMLNVLTEFEVRAVPDGANSRPEFNDQAGFGDRKVDEDAAKGTLVGAPIVATDANSDVLTYTLVGPDAASFAIDKKTGQVTVNGTLDHEEGGQGNDGVYDVTVMATDPYGEVNGSDTIDVDITANDVNEKPTVEEVSGAVKTTPEINSTPAENAPPYASALDASYMKSDVDEGDGTTFKLAGDDAGAFNLTEDEDNAGTFDLTFKIDPDFDAPGDANKENTYEVMVVATDKAGLTGMLEVSVEVTNVKEDGTVTLSPAQPAVGMPITATLDDPDTGETNVSWQWSGSQTGAVDSFDVIEGATTDTYMPKAAVPDNPATGDVNEADLGDEGLFLRAVVTYTDDASDEDNDQTAGVDESEESAMGTSELAVRARPAVNGAPEFESATMMRSVDEGKESGDDAGMPVTATDPENDVLTYDITGGADMDKFSIDEDTGQIMVGSATFDYDDASAQQTFEVEVTAMDPFGKMGSTMVTLTVTDVNEVPDFTAEDPDDYAENDTGAVAMFTATDPEMAGVMWSTGGTDGSLFTAEGGVLAFKSSPNYEDPKDMAHSADGPDDGNDPDIEGDTDDDAMNNVYVVKVRATEVVPEDQVEPAKYTEIQVRVTVTNVDEAGEASIDWRQPQVGVELDADASDPDTRSATVPNLTITFAWQWSVPKVSRPETDNNSHWVAAGNTDTTSATYTPHPDDVGEVLRAQATYTDGTGEERMLNVLAEFAVRAVPDGANGRPEFNEQAGFGDRKVDEDAAKGTLVGAPIVATDANSDVLTYTLVGPDAASFAIDKKTGQVTVNGTLDHEEGGQGNDGVYDVTVMATDPYGEVNGSDTIDVDITANDVNEKPTVEEVSGAVKTTPEINSTPAENAPPYASALDASYMKSDVDEGDGTTFKLAGDDAGAFNLTEDEDNAGTFDLTFKIDPDFDAPGDANKENTYEVMVVATDKAGLTGMLEVSVEVTNVKEDGTVTLSPAQPAVGMPITATLDDPDTGETNVSWQWSSSQTGAVDSFDVIEGATTDTYMPKAAVLDNPATEDVSEADSGDEGLFLRAVVTYTDDASDEDNDQTAGVDESEESAMGTSELAVRARPEVNNAPAFASATMTRKVEENTAEDGNAGDPVRAEDADEDTLAYELSGGADMDKFSIDEDTGQITVGSAKLDYEAGQRDFEVEVTARDPFGASGTTTVTITVTDMNEAPMFGVVLLLSIVGDRSVDYAEDSMDVVATYEATGTEAASATWSLSGADADDFRINNVGELTFATTPDYEDPADADMDNVYEVTVVATAGTATQEAAVTVTVTNVEDEEEDLQTRYDANGDGSIDKEEARAAVTDYFESVITKEEAREVITLYFAGSS